MIGKVFSHYKILEKLGEGGMGVVYKAHDTKLDRIVALKFLPPHLAGSDSDKARFRQEARAAAALNHPNVCVIYEIEESGEHPYISMEFIEGVTLGEKLAEVPLETKTAIDYAIQIAEALQAAHAREVIHRDIKSDNIMITSNGMVKVTDFGLAKLRGTAKLTKTSSTMGTLAYMPPEHIQGGEVDARADIFSFGVVLYEMLAGRLPFQGEYESALMYAIINEEPEPLQKYRTGLSSELLHVVNRALEKNPDERYQSVSDMLIDLKRLKRDTDKVSRDSAAYRAAVGKGVPPRKSRKSYWIGGAVGAAAVIITLALIGRTLFKSSPVDSTFGENSVAVMYFENSSGEDDLGKILADMLTSNLSRCEQIDVVSSQHLFDILKRMGMEDVKAIDRSVATDVAVNAGVRSMLLGSIYRVGGTLTANAQLCDVKTGKVLGAAEARGTRVEDVFDMVNTLTSDVIILMDIPREKGAGELRINDITTGSYDAYKHFVKGRAYINRFDWRRAWVEFQEAIRIDSTFAMAHAQSAFVTALFKTRSTSDLGPERASIRIAEEYSGRTTEQERYFIKAMDYYVHRDYERFVETCREMAAAYPNNKYTYASMAIGYFNLGDWRQSIEAWEELLAIDPEDGNAYNMRAYCYAHLGEYEQALQSVENYIAVMPDVNNTYDSACDIYLMAGRYDGAYRMCEEALRVNPEWTTFRRLQGEIHLFRGEHREALEINSRLGETHPSLALELGNDRGCYYMYLGRYADAAGEFRKVVETVRAWKDAGVEIETFWLKGRFYGIEEREIEARLILGRFLGLVGRFGEARQELAAAKSLSENIHGEAYNTWPVQTDYLTGVAALREGDYDAVRDAANSIRKYVAARQYDEVPLDYYYMLLCRAHLDEGNAEEAAAMLDSVSAIMRNHNPGCKALAVELEALRGDTENAIQRYITLSRDAADAQYNFFGHFLQRSLANYRIARLYDGMENREQAVLYYRKALDQWKDADPDLPELIVTKQRLLELGG